MTDAPPSPAPLAGVRVLEFSHMVMGPACGMVLADLGADVIKIEPASRGDNTRRLTGPAIGFFPTFNRNKRSLCVDLKRKAGIDLVRTLVADADVVLENFRPGAVIDRGTRPQRLSGHAGHVGQAAHHLHDLVERRTMFVGAGQKALAGAIDQAGVDCRQRRISQT